MAVSAVQYPVPFLMNIYIFYAPLGLRSKLKKVFPFEKLFKDKLSSKNNNNNNSSDHTNKADLHKMPSSLNDPIKSLIRPLEVPKWDEKTLYEAIKRDLTIFFLFGRVQVTPANNQVMIKKYEALYGSSNDENEAFPTEPAAAADVSPKLPARTKVHSN